ncbi:hypothetical protein FN846DRAFT_918987 [Sphaerosporella brunnea]|uniref:Uncharacterized protein n=1 Tax=Sphaerosporella brunnea TaxID=1250544 RepID=A0A5J5EXA7_9PEZI|nr:hypothetical protein FN846DRAFT_918987 [Sphaerosporella brunnea]
MTARSTTAALPVPAAGSADAVHALLAAGSIANISLVSTEHARCVSYDLDTTLLPQAVDSPGIDKKTARLLDALAAILVSRAQHEVIAIGAQVQHSNNLSDQSGKLQLVLAANAALPQTIQAYLEEVWKCMQLLAEHRQQLRLPEAKDQCARMAELIYRHNFPKFLRRVGKREAAALRFHEAMQNHISREDVLQYDSTAAVIAMLTSYSELIDLFSAHQVGGKNEVSVDVVSDPNFLPIMDGLWLAFRLLRSLGEHSFHSWGLRLPDHSTVELWRFFNKVTLIHGSIAELESVARSTRLYRLFQKKLVVEIVDYPRKRVTLPTSKDAWATLIDTTLNSAQPLKPIEPQVIQSTAAALSTRFSDKSVLCGIHCECKILQRFTTTAYKIKPINYIGVSKLSCTGCAAVFNSYNELQNSRDHRFYTRGAHGKWYFPWFLPEVGGVEQIDFTNRVYSKLAGQYAQYLKTVALSDSSALSEGSQEASGTAKDWMRLRAKALQNLDKIKA